MKTIAFLSILLLTNLAFGQTDPNNFLIDTTISNFHLALDVMGTKMYTKDGDANIRTLDPTLFSVTVMSDPDAAKEYMKTLYESSVENGYEITEQIEKDTTINGYPAHYMSYTESDPNNDYKSLVFNGYVIIDNKAILLLCSDFENGAYMDRFKRTFYSIKLK